jgi:hypothetical protein
MDWVISELQNSRERVNIVMKKEKKVNVH